MAAKAMTKTQILAAIADGAGITKKQAAAAMDTLLGLAYKGAKGEKGFTVPGLGKLLVRKVPARKARMGRNPQTGEEVKIPAKPASKKVVFRLAKACKESILPSKK